MFIIFRHYKILVELKDVKTFFVIEKNSFY